MPVEHDEKRKHTMIKPKSIHINRILSIRKKNKMYFSNIFAIQWPMTACGKRKIGDFFVCLKIGTVSRLNIIIVKYGAKYNNC